MPGIGKGMLAGLLVLAVFLGPVQQARAASAAQCNAAGVLSLSVSQGLNFGILLPSTGGSATVAADALGTFSVAGGITPLAGVTPTAAVVTASETGRSCSNRRVNIVVSSSGLTGPGPTMALALTTSLVSGDVWPYTSVPTVPLYIGGTLTVADSTIQTAGTYTGTINIDVTFQ